MLDDISYSVVHSLYTSDYISYHNINSDLIYLIV